MPYVYRGGPPAGRWTTRKTTPATFVAGAVVTTLAGVREASTAAPGSDGAQNRTELRAICRLLIDDVNQALIHKGVQISVDDSAMEWLLEQASKESNSGARPLRRAIQRYIEDELSDCMIRHKDNVPERVEFTVQDGVIILGAAAATSLQTT